MAAIQDESYWCEELFQKFEFSVVRLHSGGEFHGNGLIVHHGDDRTTCLILTCCHVLGTVPVAGTMAAYFSGSIDVHYDATVLHFDLTLDLALLRATQVLEPVTPLRFFDAPIVSGWNVVALSFITMGADAIVEPGTFSGEIINEPDDAYLNCNCTSKPGASGSPIILAGMHDVSINGLVTLAAMKV
ncbi:hypothetical protein ACQ4PT_026490 [Festuca glaucescens]